MVVREGKPEVAADKATLCGFGDHEQPADPLSRWFAVYTITRHEKRLAEHFRLRKIEHFLPLYRMLKRWKDGSRVTLDLPLFPNYIFVRILRRERVRVLEVPGVVSIAGCGRDPVPLPDSEIDALRRAVGVAQLEPHRYLIVGEKVRINAGPLAGMEGVLIRKKNSFRVVLTIRMIMQSIAVEVDVDDLEPANPTLDKVVLPSANAA